MICHIDADAFFASVLQRRDPRLKGKPLLALGMGGGCVIAASYEAKAFGVKTGMRLVDARRLCPGAVERESDFRETGLASKQIEEILRRHCPVVQQMSIDEWYLDLDTCVGGAPGNPEKWALAIQDEVQWKTDISVSIGIAPTKLLAKIGGEYRKPGGITVVIDDYGEALGLVGPSAGAIPLREKGAHEGKTVGLSLMLRDRPAEAIPGIGRQRAKVTNARGWMTAWDIATANPEELRMHFGKGGPELQAELQGRIISPVTTEQDPQQSISRARSFRATSNKDILWAHVLQHLQYVTLKMRRQGLAAGGISVWLRNADYASDSEGLRLPQLHDTEEQLLPYVRACFEKCHGELVGPRCTQTGLSLWGLLPRGPRQISLFDPSDTVDREESLQESLDRLRDRFGKNTIHRGSAFIARERGGRKAPLPMAEEG